MHNLTIFLEEKTAFTTTIETTLTTRGIPVELFDQSPDLIEKIDALVIFHDNHNFDKRTAEVRDQFEKLQIAIHKIDLSGTMNVALSHLSLFFDRVKCKNVLFIGSAQLKDHPKLEVFKEKWTL